MNIAFPARRLSSAVTAIALTVAFASSYAQVKEKPQYGSELNIGNIYMTVNPMSPDTNDWAWKHSQDTGLAYEQLFSADLGKAARNGGKYAFTADAWLPTDGMRGELAEKWEMKQNPLRVEVQLRKGVMWAAKPGVMESREFVADDVVFAFDRVNKSPKKIPAYFDFVEKVEASGKHQVTYFLKNYNAEWDYRLGYGYYSGILPKEVVVAGAGNWKNVTGTGPFQVADYVQGNSLIYTKNPNYWDSDMVDGQKYKLPFVDKITYRYIKDEQTTLTAFRTAKIDLLEAVRWNHVDEMKKTVPKIRWNRYLANGGQFVALRFDQKPFDDIRVRQALNLAINRQEIINAYYGGNAEILAWPMHPTYTGYFQALENMPDTVKEIYTYNPKKAKQLLADAGYPNGFSFKVQTSSANSENDLLQMVAAYLEKIGVKMQIQTLEYGAYFSAMITKTNAPGYFMLMGNTSPTTALRKSFVKGQVWNPMQFSDPEVDKKIAEIYEEPDERVRKIKVRLMTREVLATAPVILLPTPYVYTGWWPWVKNYGGELRAGAERPGPIHARIWVDQALKKQMGY
ncbi:ABC transporter substrate-binding protein [Noviherbaspirillum sp. Root189]|uniref:ABC transporter substrate-binding protein n=1 Tax=Noviherbaspirillum sp. Root189 TaxID=1736487 RepID=UPI00070CD3D6|nr:ABC transporter substrate-binding protein [Noviherbaspirillum sp. Root189]KRB82160.1 peptide ABC transporter substrate-binding protein [Noviherbaspirillum sp. Root189]